jgi:HlyD family secretion protein
MDIQRKSSAKKKFIKRAIYLLLIVLAGVGATLGLNRLKPAAQTVDQATIWPDTVKRGDMIRQVRGLGTLVVFPEDSRWIPAMTDARVEKIVVKVGTLVQANTVIIELSDPVAQQAMADADFQVKSAEATLADLKVTLESGKLTQESTAAQAKSDETQSRLQSDTDQKLLAEGLVPEITAKKSLLTADAQANRSRIEQKRLDIQDGSIKAELDSQQAKIDGLKQLYNLKKSQVDALHVRAGIDGVVQSVPVEIGAHVTPGTNLAKVSNPKKLMAELKIAETQAKDIQLGQEASIDTRNGIIPGHVIRIDPAAVNGTVTVDSSLEIATLPQGARPDLSVEGTVTLEKLDNIIYVGRPVHGQENSTVGLFKISDDGRTAERVQVKLGRASVNTIEVLDGLKPGDKVILSDTSAFDSADRIRLS